MKRRPSTAVRVAGAVAEQLRPDGERKEIHGERGGVKSKRSDPSGRFLLMSISRISTEG